MATAIRAGIVRLREKGWARNGMMIGDRACMMQAISASADHMPAVSDGDKALAMVLGALGFDSTNTCRGLHQAISWNDSLAGSADEVIARMEAAAAKLEEEALCC